MTKLLYLIQHVGIVIVEIAVFDRNCCIECNIAMVEAIFGPQILHEMQQFDHPCDKIGASIPIFNVYSLANQMTEQQDPDGKKLVKKYNEVGQLIQSTNPLDEINKYFYNQAGQLSRTIDPKGKVYTYAYNTRNLLTSVNGSDPVSYTYDKAGKRKSMTDATGTTGYDYNTMGQLFKVTYPDNKFLQYEYDANGNRTRMTGPFGQITNYTYDSADRLTYVKDPTTNEAAYKYKLNGLLAEVKQLNGNTSTFTYDGLQTTKLEQKNSLGTILNTFAAGYDRNGNMTTRSDNSATYSYTYDALNRIQTNSQNAEQYAYDSRGNRQTLQTEQVPNIELNQYGYDSHNRLTSIAKQDGRSVNYTYTGDGLLYERKENNQTIRYYYDGNQVIAEGIVNANGSVTLKARYIRGIGLVARADASGTKAYYLSNLHGDIVELRNAATGSSNARLNQYSYDIWGNPITTQESIAQPFRYSGELWDSTTNLQYLRARWYDPGMSRFINEDTYEGQIDNPLSLNLYTYVGNNPLTRWDPTGHKWYYLWIDDLAVATYNGMKERADEMLNDPNWYTVGNWATMGTFDMVNGAINPEEPLSLQHWIDSAGTVLLVSGAWSTAARGATAAVEGAANTINGIPKYTLSDLEARTWYLEQEATIPGLLNKNATLEQQARQASELRNQFRTQARELMADTDQAYEWYWTEPNLTWEQVVKKYSDKGFEGDSLWEEIINASQRSRTSINKSLGLE